MVTKSELMRLGEAAYAASTGCEYRHPRVAFPQVGNDFTDRAHELEIMRLGRAANAAGTGCAMLYHAGAVLELEARQSAQDIATASSISGFFGYAESAAHDNILRHSPTEYEGITISVGHSALFGLVEPFTPELRIEFRGHGFNSDVLECGISCVNAIPQGYTVSVAISAGRIFVPEGSARKQTLITKESKIIVLTPQSYPEETVPFSFVQGAAHRECERIFAYCGNVNFGCSSNGTVMQATNFTINTGHLASQGLLWAKIPTR